MRTGLLPDGGSLHKSPSVHCEYEASPTSILLSQSKELVPCPYTPCSKSGGQNLVVHVSPTSYRSLSRTAEVFIFVLCVYQESKTVGRRRDT